MVFELDWMEREERYKQRLSRTLALIAFIVVGGMGAGLFILQRQEKATLKAEAEAAVQAQLAEAARLRAQIAADSTAAANRIAAFVEKFRADPAEGAPIWKLPLPDRRGVGSFLEEAWSELVLAYDPTTAPEDQRLWFRSYYVDVMNRAWYNSAGRIVWEEEHLPNAILVPEIRQKFRDPEIMTPTFAQIVRAQEDAGIRAIEQPEEMQPEGAQADSSLAQRGSEPPSSPEPESP